MSRTIQIKRGNRANLPALVSGELGYAIDTNELYIGNGSENKHVPMADLMTWRKISALPVTQIYPVLESPLDVAVKTVAIQSGTGIPSPTNIRGIIGNSRAKVQRTGKNMLKNNAQGATVSGIAYTKNADGSVKANGTSTGTGSLMLLDHAELPHDTTLVLSGSSTNISVAITMANADGSWASTPLISIGGGPIVGVLPALTNGRFFRVVIQPKSSGLVVTNEVVYPQIVVGTVSIPFEPYEGNEVSLTPVSDLYGLSGAEDEISIDGKETHRTLLLTLTGTEVVSAVLTANENIKRFHISLATSAARLVNSARILNLLCTHYIGVSDSEQYSNQVQGISGSVSGDALTICDSVHNTTVEDFKAYLAAQNSAGTPVKVLYELAVPTTAQGVAQVLKTLPQTDKYTMRLNNIYANIGNVEVGHAESSIFKPNTFTTLSESMLKYNHIPQVRFYGDTGIMTKDISVVLRYEYHGAQNYINDSLAAGLRETGVRYDGYAKVKWQGSSSIAFPKKNYTIKLYTDKECVTKQPLTLKTAWGSQNVYCMKANFIDPTQCRNVIAAKIWGDCVRSRIVTSESYVRMHALPNAGAVDGYPIIVFINDVYQGLYTMNIPKDAWMFGMTDGEGTNAVLCGENYVNATAFTAPAVIDDTDWTYEIEPADKSGVVASFNKIYTALALPEVTEVEQGNKRLALEQAVDVHSVMDYWILMKMLCLTDNAGKNQLFATYDGIKWIMSAYDMDTAFGMHWSGAKFYESDVGVSGNNLLDTVIRLYPATYAARLAELKTVVFSRKRILTLLLNFAIDIPQEAYKAEAERWPDECGANGNAMQQILSFVSTRTELN